MQSSTVLEALGHIEAARERLIELAKKRPEGWKKNYGLARNELHDGFEKLSVVGQVWFADKGPDIVARFDKVISAARTKISQHQARYPVLIIENQGPDYLESMIEVDRRFSDVINFVHEQIEG